MLCSFHRASDLLPPVFVVSDGSLQADEVCDAMRFWPRGVGFCDWIACSDHHLQRGRGHLAEYAGRDVWGRKLAGILARVDDGPVLYCDSDVLWFRLPRVPPAPASSQRPVVRMARDNMHCYDPGLLRALDCVEKMMGRPPLNAGTVYLAGDLFSHSRCLAPALAYAAAHPHVRTEQTTLALLAREFGDEWSEREILISLDDTCSPLFGERAYRQHSMARHYSGPAKFRFWMDAWEMLCASERGRAGNDL
jgi:hypothetical protein